MVADLALGVGLLELRVALGESRQRLRVLLAQRAVNRLPDPNYGVEEQIVLPQRGFYVQGPHRLVEGGTDDASLSGQDGERLGKCLLVDLDGILGAGGVGQGGETYYPIHLCLRVPRTERVGAERIGVARLHKPRGWMLGRPEVTGLRFAAGEPRGYHPRHLQELLLRQFRREDRRVPTAAVGLRLREIHERQRRRQEFENPTVWTVRNADSRWENTTGRALAGYREAYMAQRFDHGGVLRVRDGGEQRVTPLELFFDLVYVFAITQLSHLLLKHPTIGGALETLFLLLAVWGVWVYTAWFTNWFHPDRLPVRLVLVAVMLASLLMSVAIPEAFGKRGLMFALAYVTIQVGRTVFVVIALNKSLGRSDPLSRNFQRILFWLLASGGLWIIGGLLEGEARYVLWALALAVEYAGPVVGFYTPGLSRSTTVVWTVEGRHLAERCQLFVIIALGESILVTGTTFGEIETSVATVAAFVVAFLGSAALWWIYFARAAEAAREIIASSEDPGRIARSAYTYFHLPMIAGIIAVAAGDELVVAHPYYLGTPASIALTLGGTALFLAGHAFFKWTVFGELSFSRLVAIAALAVLIPVGFAIPALALAIAAALIVVGVAAWG